MLPSEPVTVQSVVDLPDVEVYRAEVEPCSRYTVPALPSGAPGPLALSKTMERAVKVRIRGTTSISTRPMTDMRQGRRTVRGRVPKPVPNPAYPV